MVSLTEQAVHLGAEGRVAAMISLPRTVTPGRPAIVLLNAGILNRVGPYRLYVKLSRALAAAGFIAMRLDVSGLGYTSNNPSADGVDAACQDTQAAIDFLNLNYGCEQVVLAGICSGADNAHRIARVEPRVAGGIFIDGYAYASRQSKFHYYKRKVFRLQAWRDWLKAKTGATDGVDELEIDRPAELEDIWQFDDPPEQEFRTDLEHFLGQGKALHYIYSGVVPGYSYADQFFDSFPETRGAVNVSFYPDVDHTFILEQDKQELISCIVKWCKEKFPAE